MRYSAWFVFFFSASLMVLGAVVKPEAQLAAQEKLDAGNTGSADMAPALEDMSAPAGDAGMAAGADMAAAQPREKVEETPPATDPPKTDPPKEPDTKTEEAPAATKKTVIGKGEDSSMLDKAISFLGIFVLLGVAFAMSNNRKKINWKLVGIGTGMQLLFAVFIFYVPFGEDLFAGATSVVKKLLEFTNEGSSFIFSSYVTGQWEPSLINFTFAVLPTIIFFSSLMTILYHLGIMQRIVYVFALVMQKALGTSGAESLSAAANIFVGQTEAPLVVKPYVDEMTNSELMTVMTGGFATVAGGVLALYVGMLESSFPDIAGHLLAASVMSAPAALVVGKIIYPETEVPATSGKLELNAESPDSNVIDAASRGASEGLQLALNVGAMLLAFLALIALLNYIISFPSLYHNQGVLEELLTFFGQNKLAIPEGCGSYAAKPGTQEFVASLTGVKDQAIIGCVDGMRTTLEASNLGGAKALAAEATTWTMWTFQDIFSYLFWPFAFVMGVPVEDCMLVGRLLGEKMVLNELVAYSSLKDMLADPNIQLQDRSVIIVTYALCGFANFGSIGIQLGGIGGLAPKRRGDLAKIAVRAMLGGTLAAFMTGTVAGILV